MSNILSFFTTPTTAAATTTDAFQAGLNGIGTQLVALQAQVAAAGASAPGNATLVQGYNTLAGQVQQYQTALTNAGANVSPQYQATMADLVNRLTQVRAALSGTAPTTASYTTSYNTGFDQLGAQVAQLQAQVAAAGTTAGSNAALRSQFTALATQLQAYSQAVQTNPTAYAPYVAQLQDMTNRMAQIQQAMAQTTTASYPYTQYPTTQYPTTQYPTQYPTTTYPTQYPQTQVPGYPQTQIPGVSVQIRPGHRRHHRRDGMGMDRWQQQGPRRNGADQLVQTLGAVGQVLGAFTGQQQQPYYR